MKVLVTGASGFVGSHTMQSLLEKDHDSVGLVRKAPGSERRFTHAIYHIGVDVADAETIKPEYFAGVDAVVHLVGIIIERRPKQTFQRIHVDGTRNIVNAAKQAGVGRIIYMSAIGSSPDAAAGYSRTKYEAEEIVRGSGIPFVILRPSIILGKDSEFVAQMRDLALHGGLPIPIRIPFAPIPGSGQNKFQPVFVDDLMQCIGLSLEDKNYTNRMIEVGGATQVTFDEIVDGIGKREGAHHIKVHLPVSLLQAVAPLVEMMPKPPFSGDQLKNLDKDNITELDATKSAFGFDPISFEESLDKIYAG